MGRFDGKVAIVTGADRGVGQVTAALLTDEGASVVSHDSDLTTTAHGEALIANAVETYGGLDVVVNADLVSYQQPITEMTIGEFDRTVQRNLKGTFTVTRAAAVQFRQQRSGRIVSITSDAGLGEPRRSGLAAASEGIIGMTRTVARDLGKYGVTCNAISTGQADSLTSQNASALAAMLCLDITSNVNGVVFGVSDGDIWTYSNPRIEHSIHKWGQFTMDEMDELVPCLMAGRFPLPKNTN